MEILGLHVIDVLLVVIYIAAVIYIGKRVGSSVKGQKDFYLAGRKLGKAVQFFLNFGQMADANSAASIATFVFRNGIAGVWMGLQTLFMTPYYWFMNAWFRRVRLVTMADLFTDRFNSRTLAVIYAIFTIGMAGINIGWGYLVSERVTQAMMVKAPSNCTAEETESIRMYEEYKDLQELYRYGQHTPEELKRYQVLSSLYKNGQINGYVSYLNPLFFYITYSVIVAIYVTLGGLGAAAITNIIQGILIVVFSFILIPVGLIQIGGFQSLHEQVPDHMFRMFGEVSAGEFTWYSILAILFVSWVQIHAGMGNMSIAGSAKDEMAARLGAVTGGFAKRIMIIAWAFCGLIAFALYRDTISDPDTTWGVLSNNLLGVGAIGLMLASILAANMSSLDSPAIQISALFVRNIYMPLVPNKTERHYLIMGRLVVAVLLASGIFVAMYATGILELLKFMLGVYATFGAPILLLFFWRRLTERAVLIQVVICIIIFLILPLALPLVPGFKTAEIVTAKTYEQVHVIEATATFSDVENGFADKVGESFSKKHVREPVSLYFEDVVRGNPDDPDSQLIGVGNFKIEIFLLHIMGLDVVSMNSSQLLTARFLFNGTLPFVLLFILCYLTKPTTDKAIVDRFYVKMKTPVCSDPEEDMIELEKSYMNPERFNHLKIFPNSNWEFCRWNRIDWIGFMLCWVVVFGILGLFWLILTIGNTV